MSSITSVNKFLVNITIFSLKVPYFSLIHVEIPTKYHITLLQYKKYLYFSHKMQKYFQVKHPHSYYIYIHNRVHQIWFFFRKIKIVRADMPP